MSEKRIKTYGTGDNMVVRDGVAYLFETEGEAIEFARKMATDQGVRVYVQDMGDGSAVIAVESDGGWDYL